MLIILYSQNGIYIYEKKCVFLWAFYYCFIISPLHKLHHYATVNNFFIFLTINKIKCFEF